MFGRECSNKFCLKLTFAEQKAQGKSLPLREIKYVFKEIGGERVVIESSLQFNYEAPKVRLIHTKLEFYILKRYREGKKLSRFTLRFSMFY